MAKIEIYDTTLRDGTQQEGVSLSVEDKLKIARKLDEMGIDFIEGGWPGANPKDAEFFLQAQLLDLKHAKLAAFCSTRRANGSAETDATLRHALDANTPVVTMVGKTWDMHVTHVLETNLEENLAMIADSVAFFKGHGKTVLLDAEHFFDGFKANPEYALQCVQAASDAGADTVVLCDTNGGALPHEVAAIVARVREEVPEAALAIHPHNDGDVAVANALAGVMAGATQVQGTVNGYGERCGNANLLSVIGDLQLKMGYECLSAEQLRSMAEVSFFVSEIVNRTPNPYQPFVGASAFTHKAGLHASAVAKFEESYQHVAPELVGNTNHILVSELAGRSNVVQKLVSMGVYASPRDADDRVVRDLLAVIKEQENRGFQYEGAEVSFEMLVRRSMPDYEPPFDLVDFMVIVEKHRRPAGVDADSVACEATVKVQVGGEVVHTAASGNGPVNAMDGAARKGLLLFYPELEAVRLLDYKVRVVDQGAGTGAMVRVLVESTDGAGTWHTMGCSANIIEASWMALHDSLEWWLFEQRRAAAA